MTKEEAASEEVKTETKTETNTDSPAKEGASAESSTTKPAEGEGAGTSDGGSGGGEGGDAPKESGESRDGDFKSSKKRKWFWRKRDDQRAAEAAGGAQEGQTNGPEDKEAAAEKELSEAEMEADIHRQVKELEVEKEKLKARIDLYRKYESLRRDVGDMNLELQDIIQKHRNKTDSESSGTTKASPQ